ncbi:hypothetical protein Dimus_033471 [Dionaea muscipula]
MEGATLYGRTFDMNVCPTYVCTVEYWDMKKEHVLGKSRIFIRTAFDHPPIGHGLRLEIEKRGRSEILDLPAVRDLAELEESVSLGLSGDRHCPGIPAWKAIPHYGKIFSSSNPEKR